MYHSYLKCRIALSGMLLAAYSICTEGIFPSRQ